MRQQPTFYRLDRPVAGGGGRERQDGAPSMMIPLPPGWLCLQDCNLSGQLNRPVVVPFVLMHPDIGVALIDVAPASNPEADAILRRRLEAARFESIFPGHLPILHLRLDRADLPSTEAILRDAFAALPPLSVPGGDGWVSVVRRALLPRDPTRGAAHHAGFPATERARLPSRPAAAADHLAMETDTDPDMLRREIAARFDVKPPFPDMPEPAARPPHPLPWVIMAGVGGLIAVLALFGLLNTGTDTRDTVSAERTASVSAPSAAPAVAPPPAAPRPSATTPPPAASPATPFAAAAPAPAFAPPLLKSVAPSPPPAAAPPPPPSVAAVPMPPSPAPTAGAPPTAGASAAGASAAPAPAQRPAATAADRLPRVTVRQPANLRTAPDGQAGVVRVAPRGETFRVHGRAANGWVQVGDSEPRGWLHTSRLGEIEQP